MKTNEPGMTVGLKYCGGCNPNYDRVALAQEIKERLKDTVRFVPWDRPDISLVLVMHGCPTACAELGPFGNVRIFEVTSPAEAGRFIHDLSKGRCT